MNKLCKSLLFVFTIAVIISSSVSNSRSQGLFPRAYAPSTPNTTSTTVSCAPPTVVGGQSAACMGTVTDTSILPSTPTGTVSFSVTGGTGTFTSTTCTIATINTMSASCSVIYTPICGAISHLITGSYVSSDPTHSGSTSSPFSLQENCVISATGAGPVSFATSAGQFTNLVAVSQSSLPPNPDPTFMSTTFNFGFFSFCITGIVPSSTVTVTETYPTMPSNAVYWKYNSNTNQWTDVTSLVSFSGNVLTLTLTDGGIGDSDGLPNGQICDPGGLGHRDIPPVAAFTFSPASPTVGQIVNFDASSSQDPDGRITNYAWDFGDSVTGSGVSPIHAYSTDGTFTITLTVTDNLGQTGTAQAAITISLPAPGAHASFANWQVRPQWKMFSISKQGPIEPLQAYVINDGNRTVWAYVLFVVTGDGGTNQVHYTQVVQLAPGQAINGNTDPRFAASTFTPTAAGTYFAHGTIYLSNSGTQPPIGDSSFTPISNTATTSFQVRP